MNLQQSFNVKIKYLHTDGCGNKQRRFTPGDIRRALEIQLSEKWDGVSVCVKENIDAMEATLAEVNTYFASQQTLTDQEKYLMESAENALDGEE